MSCPKCETVVEAPDVPHIVRKCECGRVLRVPAPSGKHGIGIDIPHGSQFVIPSDYLRPSFNPLKSKMRFMRFGMGWFAEQVFVGDLTAGLQNLESSLDAIQASSDAALARSSLLQGVDLHTERGGEQAWNTLQENRGTAEWWYFLAATFALIVRDCRATG